MTSFTAKTGTDLPIQEVFYSDKEDYIAVVGARTSSLVSPLDDPLAIRRAFHSSIGNQYRFINQGLLQIRIFPEPIPDNDKKQRILVVFQQGYTENDIQRINEYTKKLKARIVYVKNVQELIQFLNQRIEKKRYIRKLVFFSHGVVGKICFHYDGDREEQGELTSELITQVKSSSFHYDAEVISYACRTGIGRDGSSFSNSIEAHPEESLAQKMATTWKVTVFAFEKRSSYAGTYGTDKETAEASEANAILKKYQKQQSDYASGRSKTPPSEFLRLRYESKKEHAQALEKRNENKDTGGGPIMPLGAWHLPISGETPTGLKNGLQSYRFKKQ